MRYWRLKVCDAAFLFFSIFGIFAVVPSILLSIREEIYIIAAADLFLYIFCLFLTFYKRINYYFRVISGAMLFYTIGLVVLLLVGPAGAGAIWILATTVLASLMMGNRGAFVTFVLNTLTYALISILLGTGYLPWEEKYNIGVDAWMVQSINYVLLNFVFLIVLAIFSKGFETLIARSVETRNASILGLAKLAEHRDNNTGEHLKRISHLTVLIAGELNKLPEYENYVTKEYVTDLSLSAALHDIGKVGIEDAVLLKPGPLTKEEFETVKKHTQIGEDVILEIEKNINGRSLYALGREIALYHHERWDGSGYPEGLKGAGIPLSARIVALADVYDALTDERPYKAAFTHEVAINLICEEEGKHFDPDIVRAFLVVAPALKQRKTELL